MVHQNRSVPTGTCSMSAACAIVRMGGYFSAQDLLARAVILVAGMAIPEAAREAVLARVVADLTTDGDRLRGAEEA